MFIFSRKNFEQIRNFTKFRIFLRFFRFFDKIWKSAEKSKKIQFFLFVFNWVYFVTHYPKMDTKTSPESWELRDWLFGSLYIANSTTKERLPLEFKNHLILSIPCGFWAFFHISKGAFYFFGNNGVIRSKKTNLVSYMRLPIIFPRSKAYNIEKGSLFRSLKYLENCKFWL